MNDFVKLFDLMNDQKNELFNLSTDIFFNLKQVIELDKQLFNKFQAHFFDLLFDILTEHLNVNTINLIYSVASSNNNILKERILPYYQFTNDQMKINSISIIFDDPFFEHIKYRKQFIKVLTDITFKSNIDSTKYPFAYQKDNHIMYVFPNFFNIETEFNNDNQIFLLLIKKIFSLFLQNDKIIYINDYESFTTTIPYTINIFNTLRQYYNNIILIKGNGNMYGDNYYVFSDLYFYNENDDINYEFIKNAILFEYKCQCVINLKNDNIPQKINFKLNKNSASIGNLFKKILGRQSPRSITKSPRSNDPSPRSIYASKSPRSNDPSPRSIYASKSPRSNNPSPRNIILSDSPPIFNNPLNLSLNISPRINNNNEQEKQINNSFNKIEIPKLDIK
jgi:hypothetical protein